MYKTFLTMAAVFLLAVSGVYAGNNTDLLTLNTGNTIVTNDGLSSFCKAVVKGDIETVRRLIALGEDVNQKSLGMTPAILAARYNKAEILELLIAHGANLKIRSDKGYTAKKYAELSNATDALEVINAALES